MEQTSSRLAPRQRALAILGSVVVLAMLLYPPWERWQETPQGRWAVPSAYAPIWAPPAMPETIYQGSLQGYQPMPGSFVVNIRAQIDFGRLLVQCLGVVAITSLGLLLVARPKSQGESGLVNRPMDAGQDVGSEKSRVMWEPGTRWLWIYTYVWFPLAWLGALTVFGQQRPLSVGVGVLLGGQLLFLIITAAGLAALKRYGWILNLILLALWLSVGVLALGAGLASRSLLEGGMSIFGAALLWGVPNTVYFWRRRFLFGHPEPPQPVKILVPGFEQPERAATVGADRPSARSAAAGKVSEPSRGGYQWTPRDTGALLLLLGLCLLLVVLAAPRGKQQQQTSNLASRATKRSFDAKAELANVRVARSTLTDARNHLKAVGSYLNAFAAIQGLTPEGQARKRDLEEQVKQAQKKVDDAFAVDQQTLADFLNVALNDMPDAPETREGLKLYAEAAMRNAQEFIANTGDYRKAIDILTTAKGYFEAVSAPIPAELTQELEQAKSLRYLTKERFDQVKKGMTEAEVKAVTGTPFYANVRENKVRGKTIVSWLFNRSDGGVAGIFFEKGKVYSSEWTIKSPQ